MSRWSAEGVGRRPVLHPGRARAQVEPLAALAAVFAVGVALAAYAGVLDDALPVPDRDLAGPTVERAERAVADAGVVAPDGLAAGLRVGPDGYRVNLSLDAAGRTWHAGPTPPPRADAAAVGVSVRLGPGRVRPGTLRAEVWT